LILVCNSRCTKDNLTALCRWQVVLGFLKPPGAGVAGVPLQTLYGFDRVHVPAGKTVTVELYPSLADFTQVRAPARARPRRGALPPRTCRRLSLWSANRSAT
jgi:hypothetical protein